MITQTVRRPLDDYPTPREAITSILDAVAFTAPGHILDPCAGEGRLLKAAHERYPDRGLRAIEINPDHQTALRSITPVVRITDFRAWAMDYRAIYGDCEGCGPGVIFGNPPYAIAQEIIDACFSVARPDTQILMLLRLGFLESRKRHAWWQDHPVDGVYVLSERPSFTNDCRTLGQAFGWYHWGGPKGVWVL